MKKALTVALAGLTLMAGSVFAGDGQSVFQSKGCAACHQASADTVGPSLKKIAKAYAGKKEELIKFLKGEGKAIVDPNKFAIMQPQLNTTKALSDKDLEALVDFILSHK